MMRHFTEILFLIIMLSTSSSNQSVTDAPYLLVSFILSG